MPTFEPRSEEESLAEALADHHLRIEPCEDALKVGRILAEWMYRHARKVGARALLLFADAAILTAGTKLCGSALQAFVDPDVRRALSATDSLYDRLTEAKKASDECRSTRSKPR